MSNHKLKNTGSIFAQKNISYQLFIQSFETIEKKLEIP